MWFLNKYTESLKKIRKNNISFKKEIVKQKHKWSSSFCGQGEER